MTVLSRTRVGMITSKEDVIAATNAFVKKQAGDASPTSVKKVLARYAGSKSCLDQAAVERFLHDADACAPWPIGCDGTAKRILDATDKNGDRCVDWEEFRVAAGFPPDPKPVPAPKIETPPTSSSGLSDKILTIAVIAGAASLPRDPESPSSTRGGTIATLGLAAVAIGALAIAGTRPT